MKLFYGLWFFLCAGWGYALSGLSLEPPQYSLLQTAAVLPFSAVCFFALMAFELWRLGPDKKALAPSIDLKPWDRPMGFAQFVFITFTFTSIWGVVFVLVRQSGFIQQPFQYLAASVGGLVGIWGTYRVFPNRFVA